MNALKLCKPICYQSPFLHISSPHPLLIQHNTVSVANRERNTVCNRTMFIRAYIDDDKQEEKNKRKSFLTLEEAGLVELSGLSTHERFLCRLTISSLNLLRVIAEEEECTMEELNAGRICDWFVNDKLKREQNIGSAVLQWDDSEFPL
ncbi:uncharacterized protein LOC124936667 [Impatiens glandulifera]|uniref:uncharacterized protein LOC124936667 n=1 Tax=Impatiens glandulifera TaxID=253017 RepID=UPI001FB12DAF|nr:uncharacterized protein LOC124936667 [Impatiens glandulifera]